MQIHHVHHTGALFLPVTIKRKAARKSRQTVRKDEHKHTWYACFWTWGGIRLYTDEVIWKHSEILFIIYKLGFYYSHTPTSMKKWKENLQLWCRDTNEIAFNLCFWYIVCHNMTGLRKCPLTITGSIQSNLLIKLVININYEKPKAVLSVIVSHDLHHFLRYFVKSSTIYVTKWFATCSRSVCREERERVTLDLQSV